MQVGLLATHRAIESFRPNAGRTLTNWIALHAKHAMWGAARKCRPSVEIGEAIYVEEDPSRAIDIDRAIAGLDGRRKAIVLLALTGHDGAEIGATLGISRQRVAQILDSIVERIAA